jgi:CRISPR-associated Cas5-like protein
MKHGIHLRVSGDYALFSHPEMKVECVSYDVMTPSAANKSTPRGYQCGVWPQANRHLLSPTPEDNIPF